MACAKMEEAARGVQRCCGRKLDRKLWLPGCRRREGKGPRELLGGQKEQVGLAC